ncbi:MAG: translocation/assembly module TamB domain-containing protein [Balneolaceae bacterium]|nr:translocation/assembly module TamB domain-containing protein [Balneolaceae bacterium]
MSGRVEDLQARGQLNLRNGRFRLVDAGIQVDRVGSTLDFERDSVVLRRFSARSGNGTLTASGAMNLDQLRPGEMDVSITARNFRAANTARYNASVNLDAHARGTPGSPRLSGTLDLLNGFITMDNFGERSVESVQLDSVDMVDYSVALYDSLGLDMDVRFNRRFFVRNRRYLDMELELQGEVDLLKDPGSPMQIFGTLNSVGGYARPLGKRFSLEEGMLTFSGDPYNPEMRVRSLYVPPQTRQDIRIWYVIEGTVEDPQFKYESTPSMELENIISYTLFGQPFYALDSWKQVVAGTGSNASAADVALDVLLDRVETLATQRLGIDVVRIDNTRVGGESGTAVTTGWYLNSRVFFAIQNVITDATPDTSFLLEYLLRENLKLIISQGNDSRQGIDLKWNYDY